MLFLPYRAIEDRGGDGGQTLHGGGGVVAEAAGIAVEQGLGEHGGAGEFPVCLTCQTMKWSKETVDREAGDSQRP